MSYLQTVVPNRDPYLVAHLAICLQVKWRNGRASDDLRQDMVRCSGENYRSFRHLESLWILVV